jgi:glycosyltransferase involved in cell wall biosynthesis
MRLAFLDVIGWEYDADTPYQRPMGGTQSAAVYLAAELAAAGHDVAFVNETRVPHASRGVRFEGRKRMTAQFLNGFDSVIVISGAVGLAFRKLGIAAPLILWTGHAHDQAAVQALRDPAERESWSAFAMVSDWQAREFQREFGIPVAKTTVMRYAVSPAFLEAAPQPPWFTSDAPPVLTYTSTPFRGLDVLLMAFPAIRERVRDARLRVFSSMAVYQVPSSADRFEALYSLCRALPGAQYEGSVAQRDLAREVATSAMLAYPCTFAETSCIAVMEAMASGAAIVTSRLGALEETSHGFGRLLALEGDRIDFTTNFAAAVADSLLESRRDPRAAMMRRDEQLAFVRNRYTWKARSGEWIEWLESLDSAIRY